MRMNSLNSSPIQTDSRQTLPLHSNFTKADMVLVTQWPEVTCNHLTSLLG